jgi:hypothetical protein
MPESVAAQRCCESHTNWTVLAEHLIRSFPQIEAGEVLDILIRTQRSEEAFGLPEAERLDTAETVARHQLMQLTGQTAPVAHLDPEQHQR